MNRTVETNLLAIISTLEHDRDAGAATNRLAKHAAEKDHPMRPDNTHHLLAAAQRRRDSTLERAQRALRELSETTQRYTVTDIAARAGFSELRMALRP